MPEATSSFVELRPGRSSRSTQATQSIEAPPALATDRARAHRSWPRRVLSMVITVLLVGALWFFFAPTSLGGYDSYAITNGTSMLPAFHTGDLVILRQQSSYHVGEVAGYHDKMLGVVVMHQIVGRAGKRFIFKGENNSFDDPYEPVASGIVGAEWIHIPRIGFVLRYLRDPWVAAVIFPMLWLASFGEERTAKHSRKRSLKRSDSVGEPELAGSSRP
jgi:signal peptidase I